MNIPPPPPGAAVGSEAARDAVAAIVEKADERSREKAEHEATQVADGPKRPFLARPAVAGSLMLIFVSVLALDVYLLTRPVQEPTSAEIDSMARMETAAVALQLEAYEQKNGRYPASLGEAAVQLTGVEYTRTAQGYVLQAKNESSVSLRADQNPEELLSAVLPTRAHN